MAVWRSRWRRGEALTRCSLPSARACLRVRLSACASVSPPRSFAPALARQAFGSARSVACAAEHGFWYRFKASGSAASKQAGAAATSGADGGWQTNYADRQMTWSAREAGTYVTIKGSSLTWKYDEADPEFGAMQAKELHHQMEQVRTQRRANTRSATHARSGAQVLFPRARSHAHACTRAARRSVARAAHSACARHPSPVPSRARARRCCRRGTT